MSLQITISMDERRLRRESRYNKYTVRELSTNLTTVRITASESNCSHIQGGPETGPVRFDWSRFYMPWIGLRGLWLLAHFSVITGLPNGRVLFCMLSSVVVVCRASASSVTLPAVGPAGRRARARSTRWLPGAWAIRRPTLHGGPVRLRPVRATPCFILIASVNYIFFVKCTT